MKKYKTTVIACVLVSFGLLPAGCHGPYKAKKDEKDSLEHRKKVVLMDHKLRRWLRIDAVQVRHADSGLLEAYCEIRNRQKKNVVVEVQTVFKDEIGTALEDMTNWETVVIPQSSIYYYTAAAMTDQAKDFVIRIKLPKTKYKN